ncbi:hypothetical protein OAM01_02125 [bacterium]|nr:hypothetical protein [bacterium]
MRSDFHPPRHTGELGAETMNIRRISLLAVALLTLVFALVFGLSQHIGPAPLTVRFLNFTNDISGEQVARFKVTNSSEHVVKRESHCHMELKDEFSTFPNCHIGMPILLKPGESEEVRISVPINLGPCRVALKAIRVDSSYRLFDKARKATGTSKLWTRWYNRRIEFCWSTAEGVWLNGDEHLNRLHLLPGSVDNGGQ